jgi:hypothetical protein
MGVYGWTESYTLVFIFTWGAISQEYHAPSGCDLEDFLSIFYTYWINETYILAN